MLWFVFSSRRRHTRFALVTGVQRVLFRSAAFGIELLHTLHQSDIAFADQLADRQAIAAVTHRDLRDEAEVRGDELRRRFTVFMLLKTFREHIFLLGRQKRKFADFGQIAVQRSEEHTSELQSLMRISYAVFCLKKTT